MEARLPQQLPEVTDRQLEVARLVAAGFDNPRIAEELGISLAGAKYHVSALLTRLNLTRREEITDWYRSQSSLRGSLRRFALAPVGWAVATAGGAAVVGAAAVVAIAFSTAGSPALDEPVVPPPVPVDVAEATGAFVAASNPTVIRLRSTATALPDGRVLFAGGRSTDANPPSEVYDPATGKFEQTGTPIVERDSHEAALLADGRVLLLGGLLLDAPTRTAAVLASTEAWQPATGAFTSTASMIEPRWAHAVATLPDGRVLVSGGMTATGDPAPPPSATAEIYDPKTDTFTATGPMNIARRDHQLTLLPDGRVLVTGRGPLEVYDPASGVFSMFGGEPVFGSEPNVATLLPDGRVLITGVYDNDEARTAGRSELATAAFIVDPVTGAVVRVGDTVVGRGYYHTATVLDDGRVLLVGGAGGFGEPIKFPPPEIFDPATGSFEVVAEIEDSAMRGGLRATNVVGHAAGHTATRLPDGSVLLVGSNPSGLGPLTTSAERFDPSGATQDDRFGDMLAATPRTPPLQLGDVVTADNMPRSLGVGEPLGIVDLLDAFGGAGLVTRELPVTIGACSDPRTTGQGLRLERPGSDEAQDFYLFVYTSSETLADHWLVDQAGTATPVRDSACDRSGFGGIGGTITAIDNLVLVILDRPFGSFGGETSPGLRAALVEALSDLQP